MFINDIDQVLPGSHVLALGSAVRDRQMHLLSQCCNRSCVHSELALIEARTLRERSFKVTSVVADGAALTPNTVTLSPTWRHAKQGPPTF